MTTSAIRKILVPIDGSEPSFDAASFAINLAAKYDAHIHLLHIVHVDQILRALGIHIGSSSYAEEVNKHVEEARKEASKWFERIAKEDVRVTHPVKISTDVKGTSFSIVGEIVDYAEKNDIDLIVMGTRGLGGFSKVLTGSVATGVVNYSSCPVLIVR